VKKKHCSSEDTKLLSAQDEFILEWGRMSSSWGINRTMAQIHALLFIVGEPMTVEEIIQRLEISRGNASMNLRDLLDWGVVRRFRKKGERKDRYLADTDALTMVARVIRERKRRELDPTVNALETCLAMLPDPSESERAIIARERIEGLMHVFDTINIAFKLAMSTDDRLRWIVEHRQQLSHLLESVVE
jgi:DNA-binding transcriptional regulator GbsR (MarR family)